MDFDNSDSPGRFFASLVKELKSLAISNIEYFKTGTQSHHATFHSTFCMLFAYLDLGIEPCFREIAQRVHEFDASPAEKGNGYRSLLRIVQKCCLHLLQLSRYIAANKDSMLFRRHFYMKELEAYVATLGQLRACLYYAQKLMTYCQPGCLFADEENLDNAVAEQLMTDVEMLSQDCFYGRCLGFQYCESMQRPLQVIAIAMASFAEGYQENSQIMKVATSLFNSGKYLMNPDLRAQQVVNITRTADIQFCKAFWSITEMDIMHQLPNMVCPAAQVDEVFQLGPDAFDMPSADGQEEVTITPPCAHTGPAPVQVRLISHHLREGQQLHMKSAKSPGSRTSPQRAPRSHGLIVHCHGGGFVAQSSKSHEVYLRHWAKDLDVPILSIDYSLAPESPFPRALEECFYAYAWAVQNCEKLGSTGEIICLAGDSAGGNLMVTTAMRAASFNIRRPDAILGVYPAVLVRYTPSPARLLCLMDPLLPAGILSRCLAAYAGVSDELSSQLAASVNCHIESSAATLRLSAQENSEADWVVVSQDAAASTNTTLAKPQQRSPRREDLKGSPRRENVREVVSEEALNAEDEVELFSRPKAVSSSVASTVAEARDMIVSYVGSCTHMLTKNWMGSGGRESPPAVPLQIMGDSGGSLVDEEIPSTREPPEEMSSGEETTATYNSVTDGTSNMEAATPSFDQSPCSPSYHTPLTSPGVAKPKGLLEQVEESVEKAADALVSVVTNSSHLQQVAESVALDIGVVPIEGVTERMSDGRSSSGAPSCDSGDGLPTGAEPDAKENLSTSITAPAGQSAVDALMDICQSGRAETPDTSVSQSPSQPYQSPLMENDGASELRRSPDLKTDEDQTLKSGVQNQEHLTTEGSPSHLTQPFIPDDKLQHLHLELDNSVLSGTDSMTLPSSLMSTPSDDLNSYEILGEGNVEGQAEIRPPPGAAEREVTGMETDKSKDSAASAGHLFRSPADEALPFDENVNLNKPSSHSRELLPSSSAMEEIDLKENENVCPAGEILMNTTPFGPRTSFSCDEIANMRQLPLKNDVLKSKSSTGVPATSVSHPLADDFALSCESSGRSVSIDPYPLCKGGTIEGRKSPCSVSSPYLTPSASQCLSHIAQGSAESCPVSPSEAQPAGLSRSNLHLDLRSSVSTTSSVPRSASLPVITEALYGRSSHGMSPSDFKRERHPAPSPIHAIRNIPIVKNPYMSPLLAPDWLLEGLPKMCLVGCHLDPLLDDSVMFARRLRSIGKEVELVLIDELPHGFLNFSLASKDAKNASDLCAAKLRKFLYPGDSLA